MPQYNFEAFVNADREGADHGLGMLWRLAEDISEMLMVLAAMQEAGAIPADSGWLDDFEGFHAELSKYIHELK